MRDIRFVDTTVRDGQASLWAMNMRTIHMLSVMPYLDAAGFESMEFIATGSRLKKSVRHLKENPWDWIRGGVDAATKTPLRWHGQISGSTLSGYVTREIGELLVKKAVALGIRLNRLGNNWNDYSVVREEQDRFERLGMASIINVIYSVSPRHTDEYFVRKTREAAAINPYRLCLKDVGGLLTPERVRELVPQMMQAAPGVVWEFHGHCNNGLGPINAIECAKLGIEVLHTSLPPLANANSQPSIYNIATNLRELGFNPMIDEEALRPASAYLEFIAKREKFQIGMPYEFDERLYTHQVPGGMISNLKYQLSLAGVADKLDEVLEEIPKVRAEFGFPIMVTPLSQIVGSQAAINVIIGQRYGQVTDETIEYALGRQGREAPSIMDSEVRDKILNRPRARELEACEPEEPTLSELRERYGHGISDEDLILKSIVGDDALDVVTKTPTSNPRRPQNRPLVELIRELIERDNHKFVSIQRNDLSLTIRKNNS